MTHVPLLLRSWLVALPLLLANVLSARADVYATNIKFNGSLATASIPTGASAYISYTLNEPASGGVIISVLSSNGVVRSISIPAGIAGTLRGTNTVVWDGTDTTGTLVSAGSYWVAITATSHGYSAWTQITDDNADGNAVWEGRGIAIDRNRNSPYYGRVFVANAQPQDPGANNWLGYQLGILKCNADGSYADDGGLSSGGYPWAGDTYSPWHLEVAPSDRVYVNDFTTNGQIISWDPSISPSTTRRVLRPDNWSNLSVTISGPGLSGTGTNLALWMADTTGGLGILRYSLLPDGTCAQGDKGTTAVAVGGSLDANPVDAALDSTGHVYTIEDHSSAGDSNNRVFRFSPDGSAAVSNADWAIGANDDTMAGARGIAVDPTGTYLAVAFTGLSIGKNGCTQILYATNGGVVTNLDLGLTISGFTDHEDEDCSWDAVGNVYYIDNIFGVWRAVSPPGTNASTTVSVQTIEVGGTAPSGTTPVIKSVSDDGTTVVIEFAAGTNDTPSQFSVEAAPSIPGPYSVVSSAVITSTAPGQFKASFLSTGTVRYFRIVRQIAPPPPPTSPVFNSINISGGTVVLSFSGGTNDVPSSFTIRSSATVDGVFVPASTAVITQSAPGQFQASVPLAGLVQFYRVFR